jgi:endonuclease/exonuclease/phosphatase (EEP) superfamily protein YafD
MCAIWALVRTLGLEGGYPFVGVIAYTPYAFGVAVIAFAVALGLRRWAAAGLAGLAVALLALALVPRVSGGPDDVEGTPLRVMSANVLKGRGDAEQLLEHVREHDVELLTVQELTPEFAERFRRAGAQSELPHSVLTAEDGVIGSGIYSSHPLRGGPGHFADQARSTVELGPGAGLEVLSVHPPIPNFDEAWRNGLRELPSTGDEALPWLLLGDFNATWDHDEFRDLVDRGYADAGERMGQGLTPTWPATDKPARYLPVTIDHLLYDRERFGVRDYEVLDLDGSDHRPLYAELVLRD